MVIIWAVGISGRCLGLYKICPVEFGVWARDDSVVQRIAQKVRQLVVYVLYYSSTFLHREARK